MDSEGTQHFLWVSAGNLREFRPELGNSLIFPVNQAVDLVQ